jgi:hypothetical protein
MRKSRGNSPCPCGSGKKFKFCHGLNKPFPPPENLATVFIDPETHKKIVVTKDILVTQIQRDGPFIAKSFDWPAPGSADTELGVLMEPEVGHGETEVYARVQA